MKRLSALAFLWILIASPALALNQASVPPKFPIPWGNSAGGAYIRSIPTTSQIGIQNCAASLTDGFPPLTFTPSIAGGCPPFGQDMNGILKQLSQWGLWQGAGATVVYDSGFSASIGGYPIGAIVAQASNPGQFWVSTVDGNTSNPDTGGANWIPLNASPLTVTSGAATTYAIGQCSATITRSNAGSPMADTLPGTGPGVLRAGCKLTILNNDASALLSIKAGSGAAIKNLANFALGAQVLLGPGQGVTFQSDGANYFPIDLPDRTTLGANTTFYVAPTGGSNSNTGLTSSAPLDTLQFAFTYLQAVLDLKGYNLTIQASAAGTFPHGFVYGGSFVGQVKTESVLLEGTEGTFPPSTYVITESVAVTSTIDTFAGARFKISGFKLTNSNSTLLRANQSGTHIILGNIEIGPNGGSSTHVASVAMALMEYQGNIYFDKVNASGAFITVGGGTIYKASTTAPITFTFDPTIPSFNNGFVTCENSGTWYIRSTINFVNTFVGVRYAAAGVCVIDTGSGGNVNYFPGTVAGAIAQSAVYQ